MSGVRENTYGVPASLRLDYRSTFLSDMQSSAVTLKSDAETVVVVEVAGHLPTVVCIPKITRYITSRQGRERH